MQIPNLILMMSLLALLCGAPLLMGSYTIAGVTDDISMTGRAMEPVAQKATP